MSSFAESPKEGQGKPFTLRAFRNLPEALLAARAASLLPLPAAVGALEASQALAMASLGLPPAYGVSLSLLIRGRDVLFGLFGLALAAKHLQRDEAPTTVFNAETQKLRRGGGK